MGSCKKINKGIRCLDKGKGLFHFSNMQRSGECMNKGLELNYIVKKTIQKMAESCYLLPFYNTKYRSCIIALNIYLTPHP